MRKFSKQIGALCFALALLAGCATPSKNDAFVRSINFTPLDTFSYSKTLVSGFDWRDSEKLVLRERSEAVLTDALTKRDFEVSGADADFFVVVKWRKAVSATPGIFDSIDGATDSLNDRREPGYRFAARLHLTVEMYETATREIFWRQHLPNIFDANEFTEERIDASLRRAIQHFPERVEKDPALPTLE